MKVGLYVVDMPSTVGGSYVMRDDVMKAALNAASRHSIELVRGPALAGPAKLLPDGLRRRLRLQPSRRTKQLHDLEADVRRRGIQMLWFNHLEPVDVGLPFILNIFDLQHRLQPWFPEVSANGQWDNRERGWGDAVRRASIVTVGSQEQKELLSFLYCVPRDNIYVVEFPTPSAAIAEASKTYTSSGDVAAKYGIRGPFLFYPAQFWPHKNHVNLVRALAKLRDKHGLPMSLVFTGADHGNVGHVQRVVAEHGLTSVVHFLGFIPHSDVIALYRSAYALAFVSYFGPENLPPLEAMALECPVVLADIPGVRALFGDCPVLVDPKSDDAIADGIMWLHHNPEQRKRRIQEGRQTALQNTAEEYVRKVLKILNGFEPIRRCWP